jgi:hypothetical protein
MRVRLALVPLIAAAALLAGCATGTGTTPAATTAAPAGNGVAALSADEILAKAKTALAAAKSFHVKGEKVESGASTKVDLKFAGTSLAGTIETQGVSLELVSIGNDLYMKAPDAFWATFIPPAQQQTALGLLKGKYVKVDSTNAAFSSFKDLFKTDEMVKPDGTVSKGEQKTINGTPAIGLVDSADSGVLYIATTGDPLPVAETDKTGKTEIEFTEFNATFDIKAPAASDVFDLKALMGGS